MRLQQWILANKEVLLSLLLASLFLLPALSFGLWEPWEPKYAQAVVEMSERGDYLTPYYRGEPRFSKPILPYWVIAVSYTVFGVNEVATRLPFALFAVASIGVLVHSLGRLFTRTLGFLAGLILLTSPMFYLLARQAMPDILFVANLTIAFCLLALGLFEDEARGRRMLLFYIFAALAVLSKGPLGVIIIGTVVGLYLLLTLDFTAGSLRGTLGSLGRLLFRDMKLHWGAPLFLVITLPWYVYSALAYDVFLDRLRFDYLDRFSDPEGDHGGGIGFYVETLAFGLFPWSALIPGALLCLALRPKRAWSSLEKKHLFFLCWFICPFLMFSAAATKFGYYVSPVLPALAFLAALYVVTYMTDHEHPARYFVLSILAVGIFLLPARELFQDPKFLLGTVTIKRTVNSVVEADPSIRDPRTAYLILYGLFGAILLASAGLAYWKHRRYAVVGFCVVAVLAGVYNAHSLVAKLSPHKTQKHMVQTALAMMGPEDKLGIYFPGRDTRQRYEWSAIEASAIFYTNQRIYELTSREQAAYFFTELQGTYCIVRARYVGSLERLLKRQDLSVEIVDTSHYRFTTVRVSETTPQPSDEQ
jgi:4-amino-4-deoxy-L-arabinose transferase-like glycosyltransferase